jgi:hypothetical protein
MNLEINFEENINRDVEYYQTNPFEMLLNGAILKMINMAGSTCNRELSNLTNISEMIDLENFAYETSMADIVRFTQALESINSDYSSSLRAMKNDYIFGVNKKYAFKPGIYDAIKDLIYYFNEFDKRTNNPYNIFRKLRNNKYAIDNLSDRIYNLMNYRNKAKQAGGNLVENIDELMCIQTNVLEKINESTQEANEMSPNYNIYNYIDSATNILSFTSIGLWTIVVGNETEMTVIKGNGNTIFHLPIPKTVLVFRRHLWKTLAGNKDYRPFTTAHALKGMHPYINDTVTWDHDLTSTNSSTYPWGVLCLSGFTDDITRSLGNNDYKSFLMGIMNWNSIYNIEDTNPYKAPNKIFYYHGFPQVKDKNEARGIKSYTSFDTEACFKSQVYYQSISERDVAQQTINNHTIDNNPAAYGKYVLNECDNRKCIFRDDCYRYLHVKTMLYESDMPEMIESFVGYIWGEYHSEVDDFSLKYQKCFSRILRMHYEDIFVYLERNLEDAFYWPPRDLTSEEMKQQVQNWHQAVNEGSTHDRA